MSCCGTLLERTSISPAGLWLATRNLLSSLVMALCKTSAYSVCADTLQTSPEKTATYVFYLRSRADRTCLSVALRDDAKRLLNNISRLPPQDEGRLLRLAKTRLGCCHTCLKHICNSTCRGDLAAKVLCLGSLSPFGLFRGCGAAGLRAAGRSGTPGWPPFMPWTSWCGPVLPPPKFPGGATKSCLLLCCFKTPLVQKPT